MRALVQDVSYSFRSLQKSRGFSFVAVVTLSLGIAANTVVFSVINAVLLNPLPYLKPNRLVVLTWYGPNGRLAQDISAAALFTVKERARSFQSIGVHYATDTGVNLAAAGPPQYKNAQRVSADFFPTLGVTPTIGHNFSAEEDRPGGPRVLILSYGLWLQDYDANPNVLGSQVRIDGESYAIVGVMPKEFHTYPAADLWLPLRLSPATAESGNEYEAIARLRDGITVEEAEQELASSPDYGASYPLQNLFAKVRLVPERLQGLLVSGIRQSLYFLFAAVLFVLLISCTNLALLLTVRAAARTQEFAIRTALGSSRIRLVRVVLMDGILIAIVGGITGAILGKELLPLITMLAPADLPFAAPLRIDGNVLLFVIAISATTVLLSALTPALRMSRVNLSEIIRQGSHSSSPRLQKSALGRLLVPIQTGLTLFLLTGTVTLLHNFLQLHAIDPGFDPQHVEVAQISLATQRYKTSAATSQMLDGLTSQIRQVRGVETAASVIGLPLERGLRITMLPGAATDKAIQEEVHYVIASPGYFGALRVRLIAGREFSERDDLGSAPVAVISEGLARKWWPRESPLGRFVKMAPESGSNLSDIPRVVVGVVADLREAGLERLPPPTVFVPLKQTPDSITMFVNRWFSASIVMRTTSNINLQEPLSRDLAAADPDLAIMSMRPLGEMLATSLARRRFYVSLVGAFGGFALLLTAIGLYGLLNYQLVLRVRELALRMAIGAKRVQIIGIMLRQGVALVAVGILLGCIATFFLTKALTTLIYNASNTDVSSVAIAALLLATIAIFTSLLVAVRTTAIEPMVVLRIE